ncbi:MULTISPECIES: riboflavin synthase [Clostridium]|uniref:riboflavin synthase n=1 Tax=Clostridium TaxID=1485 RepID=UPI000825DEB6|nr:MULTISPECIES: riboflavin synthase [Clostridium]PJI07766.1 riboflavin synthase [Clostridium sp. CT7]
MFTGLIEEIGEIRTVKKHSDSIRLSIKAPKIIDKVKLGDSIAINGVCLTVVSCEHGEFDVMPETFKVTNLRNLTAGSKVNLERALALGDRFAGHIVSGHIDGTGIIQSIKEDSIAIEYIVKADKEIINNLVYKGSVAVDGVSLTLGEVKENYFKFYLIPHTQEKTTLTERREGDILNIECDILAKYIRNFMNIETINNGNQITDVFLRENGFM